MKYISSRSLRMSPAVVLAAVALTPAPSHAQVNTAYGGDALVSITTGTYDSAFGAGALLYDNSGSYNSAFGADALLSDNTGSCNTACGNLALSYNTSGSGNTAIGWSAMAYNESGGYNTATGFAALASNNVGTYNVAYGFDALWNNTYASGNIGVGAAAGYSITSGSSNTAVGNSCLRNSTTGNYNIAIGNYAGYNISTGSNNIQIGTEGASGDDSTIRIGSPGAQTTTYIAGINGVSASGGVPVYINSNGQLGTVTSSRRFKYDIRDLGDISDRLMKLRPVTFRYKLAAPDGSHPVQYGLIAEEVAAVCPEMVQFDKDGKPFTVYYQLLTPMLLNEFQKATRRADSVQFEVDALKSDMRAQRAELDLLKHNQSQPVRTPITLGVTGIMLAGCLFVIGRKRA